MIDQLVESLSVDMDVKFLLQIGLVTVKLLGRELGVSLRKFIDNLNNHLFRFAFSLDVRQDMVDVVRNYVPFLSKRVCFPFFSVRLLRTVF